ncbi:MAG: hypothetical protein CMH31_05630 [Micavibrio sp.]|nr:hypothetical protein [Micavibrio sp.]|tara:strand:- start:1559 stop:1975 length:417 start_codon:yes stop_codon:yes gene_type:complete
MSIDKRRKAYSLTLIGCLLAITVIGLANVWSPNLLDATLYKVLGTLAIVMGLSGLLYTLTFRDGEEKTERSLVMIIGGVSTALAAMFIAQIWFEALGGILFGKLTTTGIIIAVLAGLIITLKDDFFENKRLKDENYLD